MATTHRLRSLIIAVVAAVTLAVAAAPAYAAPQVHVRVEGRSGTVVWSTVTPFTGAVQGHTLSQPTPLGALITATNETNVPLGCSGLIRTGSSSSRSTAPRAHPPPGGRSRSGRSWPQPAPKRSQPRNGEKLLFYYTKYDPVTFATQPTLGISDNASSVTHGGRLTVKVRAYDDAGHATLQSGAEIWVGGAKAGVTGANGQARVTLTTKGRFQVRATCPGKIRSARLWVRVT